jgi:hypothetical protein
MVDEVVCDSTASNDTFVSQRLLEYGRGYDAANNVTRVLDGGLPQCLVVTRVNEWTF